MAAATPADTAAQLAALREALAFEQQARIDLTDDVARLREEVASLEARRSRGSEGSLPFGAAAAPAVSEAAGAHGAGAQATPEWFDDDALLARGLSPDEVERLRTRFEAAELDELYLRDLAVREGWDRTPRFRKELNESREALRTELGDEDYDRVLFATGRNNRVLIQDVLRDSPASSAGLRGGDVLVRYDGQLILDPQELRNATTGGRAGETVAVDVMRGEQTLRLYIPRGPMGARLGRTLGAPEE